MLSPPPPPFLFTGSVAKLFGKNRSIGNDTTPFIAFTYFVYHMVVVGVHTVEILFVKYVFKWGADSIGLFGSIHGLMEILSMLAMPIVVSKVTERYMDRYDRILDG